MMNTRSTQIKRSLIPNVVQSAAVGFLNVMAVIAKNPTIILAAATIKTEIASQDGKSFRKFTTTI